MRRGAAWAVVAVVLALACAGTSFALEIPDKLEDRVTDRAGVLDPSRKTALEVELERFEEATSNQVVVAIFPSLEGEDLESWTMRLVERWPFGKRGRNNGVLLAVFMQERKARIEVGYGLEGTLPDAVASQIIRNELAPAFREQRYADGITAAVAAIELATRGEYRGTGRSGRGGRSSNQVMPLLFILAILFLFGSRALLPALFGARVLSSRGTRRAGGFYWGGPWIGGGMGGGSWGGGGGGGFSAGGGQFGGGGASGGW